MELHERIKDRRIELKMSQDELASKVGYSSRSTIAKIEAGINDIPQAKIDVFAEALQTTSGYLMGLTENNKSYDLIDYFENTLIKIVKIIEDNGYKVDYDNTHLVLIYDRNNNLIKTINEEDLVKSYEDAINENSTIVISKILDLFNSEIERKLIEKYNSLDARGKHTVNTVLEMEYKRCSKPYLLVNAAHEIEGASEEDKAHDDALMDDDNF